MVQVGESYPKNRQESDVCTRLGVASRSSYLDLEFSFLLCITSTMSTSIFNSAILGTATPENERKPSNKATRPICVSSISSNTGRQRFNVSTVTMHHRHMSTSHPILFFDCALMRMTIISTATTDTDLTLPMIRLLHTMAPAYTYLLVAQ